MKMTGQKNVLAVIVLGLANVLWFLPFASAGSLEPAVPPGPTMKTLSEVEPRIAVQSLSGDAGSVYVIDQPGSYYFTGDITIDVNDKDGIALEANDVTIDLMGYTLKGPDSGNKHGINIDRCRNVEIRNGSIRDFGDFGIVDLAGGNQFRVIDVRVMSNGNAGMYLTGYGHLVEDCTAAENGNAGIYAGSGGTVTGNTCYGNGDYGISVGNGGTVIENSCYDNGDDGINAGTGCTITSNTTRLNAGDGIHTSGLGVVVNNTADRNTGDGIYANSGSVVARNSCSENTLDGIYGGDGNRIMGNNCVGNGSGGSGAGIHVTSLRNVIVDNTVVQNDRGIDVDSTRNFIARNTAGMNTTNYDIAGNNSYGPIVNVTSVGDISLTANANHPWANFEY